MCVLNKFRNRRCYSVKIICFYVEKKKQNYDKKKKKLFNFIGVSVNILPGSIRLYLIFLILSGKDVVRVPKPTWEKFILQILHYMEFYKINFYKKITSTILSY